MDKKSSSRFQSYCRSLRNLKEARMRDERDAFVLSGTVQMYNLSFDLSWKVMKDIITQYHGVLDFATGSPRETLRAAKSVGLISDDIWMIMLRARNNLVHDYDGELAKKYFEQITDEFTFQLEQFRDTAAAYFGKEE